MTSHSTDQGTLAGGRGHSPRASSFRRDGYHSTRRPSSWACLQSSICLCSDQVATAGTQQSSPRVSVTLQCTESDRERHSLCVMNSRSDCTGYLLVSPCDFCGCQVNRQLPCVYCTLYCMYHVYCTVLYCTVPFVLYGTRVHSCMAGRGRVTFREEACRLVSGTHTSCTDRHTSMLPCLAQASNIQFNYCQDSCNENNIIENSKNKELC